MLQYVTVVTGITVFTVVTEITDYSIYNSYGRYRNDSIYSIYILTIIIIIIVKLSCSVQATLRQTIAHGFASSLLPLSVWVLEYHIHKFKQIASRLIQLFKNLKTFFMNFFQLKGSLLRKTLNKQYPPLPPSTVIFPSQQCNNFKYFPMIHAISCHIQTETGDIIQVLSIPESPCSSKGYWCGEEEKKDPWRTKSPLLYPILKY